MNPPPSRDSAAARVVTLALFTITTLALIGQILRPWVHVPTLSPMLFTLALTAFALAHAIATEGARRALIFFAATAVLSWAFEEAGVRTGVIYGAYHYTERLGPKLSTVPLAIPLSWFSMLYPAWCIARAVLASPTAAPRGWVVALATAMILTGWDAAIDPAMAARGLWVWEQGGAYFDVPFRNFAGWVLTAFTIVMVAHLLFGRATKVVPSSAHARFTALPVIVFGLTALRPQPIAALQIVALFAMGTPSLLALARIAERAPRKSELGAAD